MFGNLGIGELVIALLIVLTFVGLPIALVLWIVRRMSERSRKQDEILARLVALEEKREGGNAPSSIAAVARQAPEIAQATFNRITERVHRCPPPRCRHTRRMFRPLLKSS